jgi:hypothetical protein
MRCCGYDGPFFVSVAVWGQEYVSFFIDFCLPALLVPGNIPSLKHRIGSKFVLHTKAGDLGALRESAVFTELELIIAVDVRLIEDSMRSPHDVLADCHRDAMHEADKYSAPIVFIPPDAIWSDGSFQRLDELVRAGKRVVFLPNVRAVKEDALPALLRARNGSSGSSSWLSPRALTRIAIDHLHPTTEEHFFEAGRGVKQLPCCLMWSTCSGDLLVRAFHLHPLLVFPRRRFAHFHQTIDGDLVKYACPDPKDYYVVTDSDELTAVEFSKRSQFIGGVCEKGDATAVAKWAINNANSVHWKLFRHVGRLHANPIVPEEWQSIEARAQSIGQQILHITRRQLFVSWVRGSTFAAISAMTGLTPWAVSERWFRIRWTVRFWAREVSFRGRWSASFWCREIYLRRIRTVLTDPLGWLISLVYRAAISWRGFVSPRYQFQTITRDKLDEWLFRRRWAISFFFRSFYHRRVRAAFLYPIVFLQVKIGARLRPVAPDASE